MKTKLIANYLPQYHITPENDKWWGKGYTDWVAVKNASPVFDGHIQPKVPLNGYYDLTNYNVLKEQANLANKYGIDGFGIYHYWFSSRQVLLTKPAEIILNNKDLDIDFMFIWDNGTWKRTWSKVKNLRYSNDWAPVFEEDNCIQEDDGVLARLDYGDETEWEKHFNYLFPYFCDKRYIKVGNKPVFVIFHQDNEADVLKSMFVYWNNLAREKGFDGMFIIGQKNVHNKHIADEEFKYQPPWDGWTNKTIVSRGINKIKPVKKNIYDYDEIWSEILKNAIKDKDSNINFGAFVNYDDSPRRGGSGKIVVGGTPEKFQKYLSELVKISNEQNKKFIFITAWNEWGEGAYLEPDTDNGYAYLESLEYAARSLL